MSFLGHKGVVGRGGGHDIGEELEAEVLFAAVESGLVGLAADEWGGEDMATLETVPHPFATETVGHNVAGVVEALGFTLLGTFLSLADGLAVGCIEGHLCWSLSSSALTAERI